MKSVRCVATSAPTAADRKRCRKRRGGGPFLDRKTRGQCREQRQQRADRKEHHAGDDGHVIARHMSIQKTISHVQCLKHILLARILTREAAGKLWRAVWLVIGAAALLAFLIVGVAQNARP
jgi:hypothetical protein